VWNPDTGSCIATLRGSGSQANNAVMIPGTSRLAVAYRSGEIEIWDLGRYDSHIRAAAAYHAQRLAIDPETAGLAPALREWSEAHPAR